MPGQSDSDSGFAGRVIDWQRRHGRQSLPWQRTRDPYRVWLSEIMLQQTQVATVIGYYERFLQRFPTVAELAAAPADDVLALWSGLGYYTRARNLHRCAQVVMERHGGRFPPSAVQLAELPGIGRSTAAAIAAFCFGERVAILDGNVKRVIARVRAYDGDLARSASERELWAMAESLLPGDADAPPHAAEPGQPSDIGDYTQGLMDLGATVCFVRRPACAACPVASDCLARAAGAQERYPVKTRRLKRGRRAHALLWLECAAGVRLVRRGDSGVWAGLWSLPEFDSAEALESAIAPLPGRRDWQPPFDHALTHFDWTLQPLRLVLDEPLDAGRETAIEALAPGRWVAREDLASFGLPTPIRKLLQA